MSELKPCPFCGKPADKEIHGSPFDWWLVCSNSKCAAEGPMRGTKKGAKEAWNARPGEAAAVAETKRRALELCRDGTKVWCLDDLIKAIEAMEPEKSCNSKQE